MGVPVPNLTKVRHSWLRRRRAGSPVPTIVLGHGGAISTESYFETGLDVLSDLGYGGLELAEVCQRLGVTTGSFYHYFTSWSAYTRDLVAYQVERAAPGCSR